MAYSNGRLYCEMVNEKLIGVSIFDVQRCLGVSSPDLTTLCGHGTSPFPLSTPTGTTSRGRLRRKKEQLRTTGLRN